MRPKLFRGWLIVGLAFLVMLLVFGSRFSLGLFIPGLTEALGVSVGSVSLVFAVSTLLSGVTQPLTGVAADRIGPARVILVGLVAMGASFVGSGLATGFWQFLLLMGVASGLAFSATNLVILAALISRWFDRRRGRALGLVTSGSKIGSVVIVPAAGLCIAAFGWRATLVILGLGMLALAPFIWRYMASDPAEVGLLADGAGAPAGAEAAAAVGAAPPVAESSGRALTDLKRTVAVLVRIPAFWLLSISLFGNGFMMNLVYLHMPSYMLHQGYGELMATGILALMAGIGIFGSIVTGAMSDYVPRKAILAVLYLARSAATMLLVLWPSEATIYGFAIIFGFLGYGAVAVSSTLTGDVFGRHTLGSVFGVMYVLHQLGGGLGIWAGGLSVDLTGSYSLALWMCVLLSTVSTAAVILVKAEPHRVRAAVRESSAA